MRPRRATVLVAPGHLAASGGEAGGWGMTASARVHRDRGDGASTGASVLGVGRGRGGRDGPVEVAGQQAMVAVGTTTQVQGSTVGVVVVGPVR